MTQQQREAIDSMMHASPFDPAGDLREQRPLFEKMVTAAQPPGDVVTTPGQLGGVPVIYVDILVPWHSQASVRSLGTK